MPIYELAALGAATCWALAGIVSAGPSRHLGAVAFNRLRMVMMFILLGVYVLATGSWVTIGPDQIVPVALSGFIGIFIGDTALFLTLNRMGPRRTAILFSTNAPMATVLGWVILDEVLSARTLTGIAITIAGVVLAIAFGKRRSQLHQWEEVRGALWIGVALGLTAALSQSVGSLVARPIMASGADAIAVSALRIGVAAVCLTALMALPTDTFKPANRLTLPLTGWVALSGLLGMGVGMTLVLFALSGGEVGIVATLSATTPVLLLPLLWFKTGERPAAGAWIGAILVVIGSALILSP